MPNAHVFVSGCYDILHAGHVQFLREARALGDYLTVCFASDGVLWRHKQRRSSLPGTHKEAVLAALEMVDAVVMGCGETLGLDFEHHFRRLAPDILAVTEDDQYEDAKRRLCSELGARYVKLPKTAADLQSISSTEIVRCIRAPRVAPLRVDFAGGWLDVPRFARADAFIANCAISPTVSLNSWDYRRHSGLGGSGAWDLLNGIDGVDSEIERGVGWQDPAVIRETGLCVWRSGDRPVLDIKRNGDLLAGLMALLWTGSEHDTASLADRRRDFATIEHAGAVAREAIGCGDVAGLGRAIDLSYAAQLDEGMDDLPEVHGSIARKYCGSGWGGYAILLFESDSSRDSFVAARADAMAIEPFTS